MRQAQNVLEVKVPAKFRANVVPDEVAEYFDVRDHLMAWGRLYSAILWIVGLDDVVDQIVIKGKNDRGEPYKFIIDYREEGEE